MASRLDCEPPALALGVTNYEDKLVMIAEYSFGPATRGDRQGHRGRYGLLAMSPLNTTIAHEIGHVLDWSAPKQDRAAKGFDAWRWSKRLGKAPSS